MIEKEGTIETLGQAVHIISKPVSGSVLICCSSVFYCYTKQVL